MTDICKRINVCLSLTRLWPLQPVSCAIPCFYSLDGVQTLFISAPVSGMWDHSLKVDDLIIDASALIVTLTQTTASIWLSYATARYPLESNY